MRRVCLLLLLMTILLSLPCAAAFTDVPQGAYYTEAVAWAVEHRVTDGMTAETFCPDAPCTRAQIVSFLWKLSGRPEPAAEEPFTDVSPGDWFYTAVCWAAGTGVTRGVTPSVFQPDRVCTRAEGAAFLYQYYGGGALSGRLPFRDVPSSAWFFPAVRWAYERSVVSGVMNSRFLPEGSFTRAHMVTMLRRAEQPAPQWQTAVFLGVEGYGSVSSKDAFRYRFFLDGKTVSCTIAGDEGAYAFQNLLMEGEAFRVQIENGVLTRLLPADTASLRAEDAESRALYRVTLLPGGAKAEPCAFQSGVRAALGEKSAYLLSSGAVTSPPVSGEAGERTVRNFLSNALMPVGRTLYVYGGGWNWQDTAASDLCRSTALPDAWQRFFLSQTGHYNYKNPSPAESFYPFGGWNEYYFAGLDCSGYVGWAVYRTLNTADGLAGYVCSAAEQASDFAARGLGRVSHSTADLRPGDIVSMSGHVWICLGRCADGSIVILHSTPSPSRTGEKGGGVQLGAIGESACCEAYRLAEQYLSRYYPAWYERYAPSLKSPGSYLSVSGVFTWSALSDPDGIRNMQAPEVLRLLFQEGGAAR